jgi:hypothetical protein
MALGTGAKRGMHRSRESPAKSPGNAWPDREDGIVAAGRRAG